MQVRTIIDGVETVSEMEKPMPRGVYERKPKSPEATAKRRGRPPAHANGSGNGLPALMAQLRAQKAKAEDQVVALGTAIEALEALE